MDLTGRAVLLTGAKRIGVAVAEAAARRGASVALAYNRSRAEAEDAASAIERIGGRAQVYQADVSDAAACRTLVEAVDRDFGRLDVLVNMASVYRSVPIDQLDLEAWDQQVDVDLRGTVACSLAVIPVMRRLGGGRIVNFSDWLAVSGRPRYPGYAGYYVAKAGVKAFTEALALEVAAENILVNAVAPGPILAPPETTDEESQAVERATPLGRWGGADEIAKVVLAFIESDFVTGETVRVDGGRHLR
jgi:NAD(P)-dependent dehydrogenase (short-subunit alcohol dehydrogenase family)